MFSKILVHLDAATHVAGRSCLLFVFACNAPHQHVATHSYMRRRGGEGREGGEREGREGGEREGMGGGRQGGREGGRERGREGGREGGREEREKYLQSRY